MTTTAPAPRGRGAQRQVGISAIACVITLVLAACSSTPQPDRTVAASPTATGDSVPLVEVQPAPSAPPQVTVAGTAVPVLSFEWFDPAVQQVDVVRPDDTFTALDLPEVPGSHTLVLDVASAVAMTSVDVSFSASVGDDGLPAGEPTQVSCATECQFTETGESIKIEVPVPDGSRVAVISLTYSLEMAQQEVAADLGYPFDYASYGVLLAN